MPKISEIGIAMMAVRPARKRVLKNRGSSCCATVLKFAVAVEPQASANIDLA
jgi:hypothetical protein